MSKIMRFNEFITEKVNPNNLSGDFNNLCDVWLKNHDDDSLEALKKQAGIIDDEKLTADQVTKFEALVLGGGKPKPTPTATAPAAKPAQAKPAQAKPAQAKPVQKPATN